MTQEREIVLKPWALTASFQPVTRELLIISNHHVRLSAKCPREPHLWNSIPLSLNNPESGSMPVRHWVLSSLSPWVVSSFSIPTGSPISTFPFNFLRCACVCVRARICHSKFAPEKAHDAKTIPGLSAHSAAP